MCNLPTIRIDIVSDVMCPWCIIGYKKLEQAMQNMANMADFKIVWQPFELNPDMPAQGQLLTEHLHKKYGSTKQQRMENSQRISEMGKDLGFEFCFNDNSRIVNTFLAHQLLHWAKKHDKQTPLKLALFNRYFTQQQDLSDINILVNVAEQVGLERAMAEEVLASQRFAQIVRDEQKFWSQNDVQAVPAFIFNKKYLLSGAQESQTLQDVIETILKETK
jgi:predicted DsbA family dithiol-disulfide isomerase